VDATHNPRGRRCSTGPWTTSRRSGWRPPEASNAGRPSHSYCGGLPAFPSVSAFFVPATGEYPSLHCMQIRQILSYHALNDRHMQKMETHSRSNGSALRAVVAWPVAPLPPPLSPRLDDTKGR